MDVRLEGCALGMGGVPTRGMEDVVRMGLKQQWCCTGEWIVAGESNLAH
jgi:hypothetical protein